MANKETTRDTENISTKTNEPIEENLKENVIPDFKFIPPPPPPPSSEERYQHQYESVGYRETED